MARNSSRQFRKNALLVIARDGGICGVCTHGGAITVDHIIPHKDWPKDPDGNPHLGLDDVDNLRPAHGSRGTAPPNPCMECDPLKWPNGRNCNQSRGAGERVTPPEIHSRNW